MTVTKHDTIRKEPCMRVKRIEKNRFLFCVYLIVLIVITLRPLIRPIHLFGGKVNAVLFEENGSIINENNIVKFSGLRNGSKLMLI